MSHDESHEHDEHGHGSHGTNSGVTPAAGRGCTFLLAFVGFVGIACIAPVLLMLELAIAPAVPVLTVFGEPIQKGVWVWPILGGDIINTMIALILVDIIIIAIAWHMRELDEIPRGFKNGFEGLFGYLYNQTKSIAGNKMAAQVFPIVASMFLIVLVANITKLIPGFESVGALHCAEDEEIVTMNGYRIHGVPTIFEDDGQEQIDTPTIAILYNDEVFNSGTTATHEGYEACNYKYFHKGEYEEAFFGSDGEINIDAEGETHGDDPVAEGDEAHHFGPIGVTEEVLIAYEEADRDEAEVNNIVDNMVVAPFFRGASTDLNFTLGMAVFAMFWVQFFGVQQLGLGYFSKFINLPALGNVGKNPMGAMDFIVGILEILSEIAKVISFTFRLFGALFAGGILLVVATFLAASIVPGAVVGLELFVGLIQAYVFFILPLALIKLATQSHH